jgi:hydroxymethylbilane synthase
MFVKEIEDALLSRNIDLAVHSLKDMPGELPSGLILGAVPKREDPRDALLTHGPTFDGLPAGARIGTSSLRRQAQLQAYRKDLLLADLRGNLDTRIRKLDDGLYDGIVLACAGLERLGLTDRITERLSTENCVPAAGQGALALEIRADEPETSNLLAPLNDSNTWHAITAERAFQTTLGAGCHVPAGAYAEVHGDAICLTAMIAAPDGSEILRTETHGLIGDSTAIGIAAARDLLAQGGSQYLEQTAPASASGKTLNG